MNIGWGRRGRLVSSGWAWVPRKNGMDVLGQFQDLHDGVVGGFAAEDHAVLFEGVDVLGIDFVAMTETQADAEGVVEEAAGQ